MYIVSEMSGDGYVIQERSWIVKATSKEEAIAKMGDKGCPLNAVLLVFDDDVCDICV